MTSPDNGWSCWDREEPPEEENDRWATRWRYQKAQSDVDRLFEPWDNAVELPYSDETWATLMQFSQALSDASKKLDKLLQRKDFLLRLANLPLLGKCSISLPSSK